ncbi:hypothetical protein EJ04DRAFT_522837 [Polyplosphaeria fusca]|uniref:Uncharacterized protein n=1 Tax=Polyplosphaeria fusca TaxID=682080 RepID=A0A9P4QYT4_9PLEO|nr:hypothetical protein EJ04DRAFT_522837 [Polyplosphaeria fusca]
MAAAQSWMNGCWSTRFGAAPDSRPTSRGLVSCALVVLCNTACNHGESRTPRHPKQPQRHEHRLGNKRLPPTSFTPCAVAESMPNYKGSLGESLRSASHGGRVLPPHCTCACSRVKPSKADQQGLAL